MVIKAHTPFSLMLSFLSIILIGIGLAIYMFDTRFFILASLVTCSAVAVLGLSYRTTQDYWYDVPTQNIQFLKKIKSNRFLANLCAYLFVAPGVAFVVWRRIKEGGGEYKFVLLTIGCACIFVAISGLFLTGIARTKIIKQYGTLR